MAEESGSWLITALQVTLALFICVIGVALLTLIGAYIADVT